MYKNVYRFISLILPRKQRKTTTKAHERYHSLSKEEKQKKQQYGQERYKNLPEDEKRKAYWVKRLFSIEKNITKWEKTPYYN